MKSSLPDLDAMAAKLCSWFSRVHSKFHQCIIAATLPDAPSANGITLTHHEGSA
jgi:hypothetical protein